MRVEAVQLRRVQIPMKRSFKHALHERHTTDAVLVGIEDDRGMLGWGEVLPRPYVTGETVQGVLEQGAPRFARELTGRTFETVQAAKDWLLWMAQQAGRELAVLCGFDLALLDLAGQRFQTSVAQMLGGPRREALPPGVIVGFETPTDKLARYCATLRLSGRKHVKIKVGLDDDAQRLAAVAKVFKGVPLRLDANAAWSADEAIERLAVLRDVAPIASIEQPVSAEDLEGLARIREQTGIAVMADESVCSLRDAGALIERQAADIFNVRLGKNGGLLASARLVELAQAHGVAVHLGTMVGETGVLSRASEVFGRCVGDFACLDGKGQNAFLLEVDIAEESGEDPLDLSSPGLGVTLSMTRLQKYQVGETRRITSKETA